MSDPITAIIVAVKAVVSAFVAAYKAYKIVRVAVLIASALAVTAISKALTPKAGKIDQGQELTLKLDPTMPRQVAAGRTATGGSQVWAFTEGNNTDAVPNKWIYRIIDISDRPIHGVVKVLEGKDELTFTGDIYAGLTPCNQHKSKNNETRLWLHVIKGSDTATALPYLVTASGGRWSTKHKGVGIAYAVVKAQYDADAFPNGEAQLVFVVDGASAYDDRDDVAYGGTQNLGDPTTWTFTRNAATITAQFLRGYYTNGALLVGSEADSRDLDPQMIIAAANTCDEEEDLEGGGTEPRYRAGMMLTSGNTVEDDLDALRLAMDGQIYDRGGGITIFPGGTRTPVMDLTDDDINWSDEKSLQPMSSLSALYNRVQGAYVPEALNFAQEGYPTRTDDSYVEADGGMKIALNQDFKAVTSDTQVQRISARLLAQSRFQTTIGFLGPLWLFELEQGDWFTLTSGRWGMTSKYFIVQSITITTDLKVQLVALETSTTVSGWSPADEIPRTTTDSDHPSYVLPVPTLALTPQAYTTSDGVEIPAIHYEITIPEGSACRGFDLQIRRSGEITPLQLPRVGLDDAIGLIANSLLPATIYQVRARASDGRLSSDWCGWVNVTTTDSLISSDTLMMGGKTAAEWVAELEAITALANEAIDKANAVVADLELNSQGIMDLALRAVEDRGYQESLTYINSVPVGTVIYNNKVEQVDGDNALAYTISLIGAKSGDNLALIFDLDTAKVSPSESWAQRLSTIAAADAANGAAIISETNARVTAVNAVADELHILGASYSGGTAFLIDLAKAYVSGSESLGTRLTSINTDLGNNSAAITSEASARVSGDTANATSISTLSTTVGGNTASISTLSTSLNGVLVKYGLNLDVNGYVVGFLANNNGVSGGFIFVANYFGIARPGYSNQFLFSLSGSQVKMLNVLVDTLDADIVTADKIVGGAVSNIYVSGEDGTNYPLNTSSYVQTASLSVFSDGGKHIINVDINVAATTGSQVGSLVRLKRDGSQVGLDRALMTPGSFQNGVGYSWQDTPGYGSHTYTVEVKNTPGSGASLQNLISVISTELKK